MKGLSIPLNQTGIEEFDCGVLKSDNLVYIDFPDEEVDRLFDDDVIDKINNSCDLGIDDYESRQIPKDKLAMVISMVDSQKYPIFYRALGMALEKGEFLSVDL